jgi:DNA repair protein RecO (recombination protein O)
MEWQDQGIVVAVRPHGESSAVVHLLTQNHGLYAGYMKGAQSARGRGILQLGNVVEARWASRIEDSLGSLSLQLEATPGLATWHDARKMLSLQSACAVIHQTLPEREAFTGVYEGMRAYLDMLDGDLWPQGYIVWEINILRALGFGIDVSQCAVTGSTDDLHYISPRSGKAVSVAGAGEYGNRMLSLPSFLSGRGVGNDDDIAAGLKMTGYFLEKHVFHAVHKGIPDARIKLYEAFAPKEAMVG